MGLVASLNRPGGNVTGIADTRAAAGNEIDRVRELLDKLPNVAPATGDSPNFKLWYAIGAALKKRFGERGRRLWDRWSNASPPLQCAASRALLARAVPQRPLRNGRARCAWGLDRGRTSTLGALRRRCL